MTYVTKRDSSFELIRVIAQYFIVLYHILLVIVYKNTNIEFYHAIWLPLHIGVPLFVMISGYFGIKTDIKRLIKLVGMVFVLQVPLLVADTIIGNGNLKDYIKIAFFVSDTPFWFVRTYLYLFLFAPVINYYLKNCSKRQRLSLLLVLFFMTIYIGTLKFDSSLQDGKNLISFIFFYTVGDTLHYYKSKWETIPRIELAALFIIINIILVTIFTIYGKNRIAESFFTRVFFDYTSVGLLFNSVVFFMLIGGLKFQSKLVNSIGKSSLAIYMIHGASLIIYRILPPMVMSLYFQVGAKILPVMLVLMLLTCLIVLLCWLIYLALTPIWLVIDKLANYVQDKSYVLSHR